MPYLGNTHTGLLTTQSLNITGDADIGGTLEADVITVDGITLSETIADTVGAMVTSNNETGITVTYQDLDNTLDFVIGTLNQNTTGSAATLTTARAITLTGDVSGTANFNGSVGITITTTIADDSHNHTIANVDGLQAAVDAKAALNSPNFTTDIEVENIKLDGNTISATDTNGNLNVSANGTGQVVVSGDLKLTNAVVETVYTLTGTALDPNNGTSQIKTLSGNVSLTDSLASGESMSLKLINGSSHTVTFPTITWVSATGNSAPTLTASDQLVFYKISSTLYGVWIGSSA